MLSVIHKSLRKVSDNHILKEKTRFWTSLRSRKPSKFELEISKYSQVKSVLAPKLLFRSEAKNYSDRYWRVNCNIIQCCFVSRADKTSKKYRRHLRSSHLAANEFSYLFCKSCFDKSSDSFSGFIHFRSIIRFCVTAELDILCFSLILSKAVC